MSEEMSQRAMEEDFEFEKKVSIKETMELDPSKVVVLLRGFLGIQQRRAEAYSKLKRYTNSIRVSYHKYQGSTKVKRAQLQALRMDFENLHMKEGESELINPPKEVKTIGVKWVFKTKLNKNGEIDKCKARLVVKGYAQKYGVDYTEVYALVARLDTIQLVITLAAQEGWSIFQLDVKSTFLHGELSEEIFVEQPPGYKKGVEHKLHELGTASLRHTLPKKGSKGAIVDTLCSQSQGKEYACELLDRFGMGKSNPVNNPIVPGCKFSKDEKGAKIDARKEVVRNSAYSDCDFARDRDDQKSTLGYVFVGIQKAACVFPSINELAFDTGSISNLAGGFLTTWLLEVLEMESLFRSPDYCRVDLAQLLRAVQDQEKQKLHLYFIKVTRIVLSVFADNYYTLKTATIQLLKKAGRPSERLVSHENCKYTKPAEHECVHLQEITEASGTEEAEADAEYDNALKEAIRGVQDAVMAINEHLDEVRYEIAALEAE
ncbi:hypothetical protein CR513_39058 [Mucuna pruriens]|uniref:Reverse transcriptase Ty1/copia-type domain-containing protein n=1 Tax=Mucuna pruriens TaxID=157652 RepID=A0A371FPY4_MUCPR|nr:hypothetical protein CR513_39058 [Mucuna pruriens]